MDKNTTRRPPSPLPSPVRQPLGLLAVENSIHTSFMLPSPKTPRHSILPPRPAAATDAVAQLPQQQNDARNSQSWNPSGGFVAGTPGAIHESTIHMFPGSILKSGGGNLSEISLSFLEGAGHLNDDWILGTTGKGAVAGQVEKPGTTPLSKPLDAARPTPQPPRAHMIPSLASALSIESPLPVTVDMSVSGSRPVHASRPSTQQQVVSKMRALATDSPAPPPAASPESSSSSCQAEESLSFRPVLLQGGTQSPSPLKSTSKPMKPQPHTQLQESFHSRLMSVATAPPAHPGTDTPRAARQQHAAPTAPETPSDSLRAQVQLWRSRYLEATASVQQMQQTHAQATESLRADRDRLHRENERLRQAHTDLTAQLKVVEQSASRHAQEVRQGTEALSQLNELVQRLERENGAYEGKLRAADERVRDLEGQLRAAEETNLALRAAQAPAPVSAPTPAPSPHVAALQAEVARLDEQLRASRSRCASLESTLSEYDRALGEATGQLDTVTEAKRALESQLMAREEGAVHPHETTVSESPGKTVILSRALLRLTELHAQYREAGMRVEELTKENFQLAVKHKDTLVQLKSTQAALTAATSQPPVAGVTLQDLAKVMTRLEQSLTDLQEERAVVNRLMAENAALKQQVGKQGKATTAAAKPASVKDKAMVKKSSSKSKDRDAHPSPGPIGSPIALFTNPLTRATSGDASLRVEPSALTQEDSALTVGDTSVVSAASTVAPPSPVVHLKEEAARLRVARDEAVSRAAELAEQVESQSRRLAQLQKLVREHARAADLLEEREDELSTARRDLERARDRAAALEADLQSLHDSLKAQQQASTQSMERLAETQSRCTELEFLYDQEVASRGAAELRVGEVERELERVRRTQLDTARSLGEAHYKERTVNAEVESLRAQIATCQGELEEARGRVRDLEASVEALEQDRADLQGQVTRWKAESERAEEQVRALRMDIDRLGASLAATEDRCHSLSVQLQESLRKGEDRDTQANETQAMLRGELAMLTERLQALTTELDECYTCIGAADSEKAVMDERIKAMSKELDALTSLRVHLETRNRELVAERHAASLEAESASTELGEVRADLAALEAECTALRHALNQEGAKSSQSTSTAEELSKRLELVEREREVMQARLSTVLAELSVQRNQTASLQTTVAALRDENGQLRSKAGCSAEVLTVLGAMADRVAQCTDDMEAMTEVVEENDRLKAQLEELRGALDNLRPSTSTIHVASVGTAMTPAPAVREADAAVTPSPRWFATEGGRGGPARAKALLSAIREFTEAVVEVATPAGDKSKTLAQRFEDEVPSPLAVEAKKQSAQDAASPSISALVEALRVRMGRLDRLLGHTDGSDSAADDQPSPDPRKFQDDSARMSSLARTSLIHELRNQCRLLQRQLDSERIERARMVALLQEGLDREGDAERRVTELQRELDVTLAELSRLRTRYEEMARRLEESEGTVARLEAHVRTVEAARALAVHASVESQGRLEQANMERDLLASRLDNAFTSQSQMTSEVEDIRDALRKELLRRDTGSRAASRAHSPDRSMAQDATRLKQDLTRVLAAEMGLRSVYDDDGSDGDDRRRGAGGRGALGDGEGRRGRSRSRGAARPTLLAPASHTASRAASRAASRSSRQASLSPVLGRARSRSAAPRAGFTGFPPLAHAGGPTPSRIGGSRHASREGSRRTSVSDLGREGIRVRVPTAPQSPNTRRMQGENTDATVPAEKYLRALKKAKKYKREAEEAARLKRVEEATPARTTTTPQVNPEDLTPLRQLNLLDVLRGEVHSLKELIGEDERQRSAGGRQANGKAAGRIGVANSNNRPGRSSSAPRARGERSFPSTIREHVARLMQIINDVQRDGYWPVTPPPGIEICQRHHDHQHATRTSHDAPAAAGPKWIP